MKPVIQQEKTGCGIAAVANIAGKTYSEVKQVANAMGIFAEDESLWSDTGYVRQLLARFKINVSSSEFLFQSWQALPDLALLSIKHHQVKGKSYWHWVVFKRDGGDEFILDSASYLNSNIRTDFHAMKPEWFIPVDDDNT